MCQAASSEASKLGARSQTQVQSVIERQAPATAQLVCLWFARGMVEWILTLKLGWLLGCIACWTAPAQGAL